MYLRSLEAVREITKALVAIPSIVKTDGEAECARWIYNYYKELNYFKENQ